MPQQPAQGRTWVLLKTHNFPTKKSKLWQFSMISSIRRIMMSLSWSGQSNLSWVRPANSTNLLHVASAQSCLHWSWNWKPWETKFSNMNGTVISELKIMSI